MGKLTAIEIHEILNKHNVELAPTQAKLSIPIINRIYKKMVLGIDFNKIKVCGKLIIDGHHRYVSSIIANIEIGKTKTRKNKATIMYKWSEVKFVTTDWDRASKIKRINLMDAKYNDIPLEKIVEMTK
ncbi:hypothetical protein [Pedobacter endophyticus]|uniref:ParB/Sulfiredoxin domain-containing protein n=1 Tax=Pedobacter endophyticus TaxID=2789740 RepID=A0A7S9L1C9_9SPHI|nr:hypothetical protein [Pedobacter endophyticus]QPH40331.1 hypothetical protein IZT61_03360 [Pedobacter endophyticus]